MKKQVNILGSLWTIHHCKESDDARLKECSGFCDWTTRQIVVEKRDPGPMDLGDAGAFVKKVLRHEIVHAFLCESGLCECSGETDAWACNETMIDWFARQGPKIYAAWLEAGAI